MIIKQSLLVLLFSLTTALAAADPSMYGKPAPQFPELKKFEGQPVLIDFWASWCGPCQESFPWMQSLKSKYPDLRIIAVNLDEDRSDADTFLRKNEVNFSIIFDSEGTLAERFKVDGMPSSYLIDRNGNIVKHHVGFFSDKIKDYESEIKHILN